MHGASAPLSLASLCCRYDIRTDRHYEGGAKALLTVRNLESGIPVLQRGGSIVVRRPRPRRSSTAAEVDPMELVVALSRGSDAKASGSLYVDDGVSGMTSAQRKSVRVEYAAERAVGVLRLRGEALADADFSGGDVLLERVVVLSPEPLAVVSATLRVDGAGSASLPLDVTTRGRHGTLVVRAPPVRLRESFTIELKIDE